MPYIDNRAELNDKLEDLIYQLRGWNSGEINYVISTILWTWFKESRSYSTINSIIGVLECIKLEFYRRKATPYEEIKREENGDLEISSF